MAWTASASVQQNISLICINSCFYDIVDHPVLMKRSSAKRSIPTFQLQPPQNAPEFSSQNPPLSHDQQWGLSSTQSQQNTQQTHPWIPGYQDPQQNTPLSQFEISISPFQSSQSSQIKQDRIISRFVEESYSNINFKS